MVTAGVLNLLVTISPISGKWTGYYTVPDAVMGHAAGDKWPFTAFFTFKEDDTFDAFGTDDVGDFKFVNGKIQG